VKLSYPIQLTTLFCFRGSLVTLQKSIVFILKTTRFSISGSLQSFVQSFDAKLK